MELLFIVPSNKHTDTLQSCEIFKILLLLILKKKRYRQIVTENASNFCVQYKNYRKSASNKTLIKTASNERKILINI